MGSGEKERGIERRRGKEGGRRVGFGRRERDGDETRRERRDASFDEGGRSRGACSDERMKREVKDESCTRYQGRSDFEESYSTKERERERREVERASFQILDRFIILLAINAYRSRPRVMLR